MDKAASPAIVTVRALSLSLTWKAGEDTEGPNSQGEGGEVGEPGLGLSAICSVTQLVPAVPASPGLTFSPCSMGARLGHG